MTAWSDDDALWQAYLRFNGLEARREQAPAEVEELSAMLEFAPGAAVLDLCCGVGRHSIEFARRGCRVTGVDRFAPFLERARTAAAEAGVASIEWVEADMRRFRRPQVFNAAASLF